MSVSGPDCSACEPTQRTPTALRAVGVAAAGEPGVSTAVAAVMGFDPFGVDVVAIDVVVVAVVAAAGAVCATAVGAAGTAGGR
jgi:hypothetical protein